MELYKYQQDALEWHLEQRYSINAFVMGLGKTAVALAMHKRIATKTLVICPKYLIQNWKEEVEKFDARGDIRYINYASLHKVKIESYDLIILDEAHFIKNPASQRSKQLITFIALKPPKYLLMLTGTPCKNDVSEVFNLMNICDTHHQDKGFRKFAGSLQKFKNRYMKKHNMKIGKRRFTKYYGLQRREEYIEMVQKYLIKKTLKEVDLPAAIHKTLAVGDFSMDKELQKLLSEFDKDAYMTIKKKTAIKRRKNEEIPCFMIY